MTTIAIKDGWIAADSAMSRSDVFCGTAPKLFIVQAGGRSYVHASVGECGHDEKIVRWIKAGMNVLDPPSVGENGAGIVVDCETWRITTVVADVAHDVAEADFHAWGSGFSLAMGAMAAGATARQAVEIGCRFDLWSGGPVLAYRLADLVNPDAREHRRPDDPPATFRRRTRLVDAVQVRKRFAWPDWFHEAVTRNRIVTHGLGKYADGDPSCCVCTAGGHAKAADGDWIVRVEDGTLAVCHPDEFAAAFEVAE